MFKPIISEVELCLKNEDSGDANFFKRFTFHHFKQFYYIWDQKFIRNIIFTNLKLIILKYNGNQRFHLYCRAKQENRKLQSELN